MTKPPTSVRSIRLKNDEWAWLAEEAARRSLSINSLVASFVALARNPRAATSTRHGGLQATPPTEPEPIVPVSNVPAAGLQLGPTPTKYGSRLKGGKK